MSHHFPPLDDAAGMSQLERLLARGVQVIRVIHPDLFGRQRGKQFPVSSLPQLLDGIAYSKMSVAEDLFGEPLDETEFPQLAGHPDLHARIDPATAVIPPWEPDALWVLATLWENGSPSPLCARGQLERSIDLLDAESGYSGQAACEPEFYLYRESDRPGAKPIPYSADGVSYTIDRGTDPNGVLGRMHRQLIDFGIGVTAVNREFSPGQFEINLHHAATLTAADQVFLMKSAVKELAIIEGYRANFMAKPQTSEEGSSLHVHLSLWEGERNAFAAEGLSRTLLSAVAGIQHHAPALLALASPTVNSYKRLHGHGLSPDTANWAEDNRYTFLRIPAERGSATRLELRAGDASASPHLLLAGINHAVRDGILRELTPHAEGQPLPRSLSHAVSALRDSDFFRASFGDEFIDVYSALKQREIERFEVAVTDWEWDLYHSHA